MTLSPVGERDRLLAPDLARGVMLALIAVANSALYLYGRPYGIRQHVVEHGLADRVVSALSLTFVDARAYPMFAALFGYGMAHIWRRRRDDAEGRAVLRRRSRWLLAFGAVHGLLLFPGDVLGLYGLLGLLMGRLMRARGRLLLAAAALWLVPVAVISALVYGGPGGRQRAYLWSLAVPDPVTALALRPLEWVMTPFGLTGAVTAALVGVWAGRRSLLSVAGPADVALLRRVAVVGPLAAVAGGLPAGLVAAGVVTVPAPAAVMAVNAIHVVTGVAGGLGYAALIGLLARRIGARRGPVVTALSSCGQRSLTCYLLQSVVFVALLPPYTAGLGGRLGPAATAALALLTWAGIVVMAELMRRTGTRGPAETLLRRLTYARG